MFPRTVLQNIDLIKMSSMKWIWVAEKTSKKRRVRTLELKIT